jgi:Mrp family chromosome partitioning ATPase
MGVLRSNKSASAASEIGRLRPDDVVGPRRASKDDKVKSENDGKSEKKDKGKKDKGKKDKGKKDATSKKTGPAKVIAFANQKGGVAKTTTALNLAVAFKESGHRVLAVDTPRAT